MIFNIGIGKPKSQMPPVFTCTGTEETDYLFRQEQGTNNWELAILKNCTINFSRVGPVDIFLVGGGQAGGTGSGSSGTVKGGNGGAGGSRVTQNGVTLTESNDYSVEIGSSGSSTTGFGYTATSGGGSSGGSGAQAESNGGRTGSTKGTDGATAFGADTSLIYSGRKYGAGGGGGAGAVSGVYAYGEGMFTPVAATDGGKGGSINTEEQTNATGGGANTGAGGGGAWRRDGVSGSAGSGGSGIIIIRNARGGET